MSFKIISTGLALLVMACLGSAAPNPQYQKPTIAHLVWEVAASNHCGSSSFTYFGSEKDKVVPAADCNKLLAEWSSGHFTYELTRWEDSTALKDHFFILATNGSCEFALKRLDGLDNTILLGDQDMKDLVHSAIASSSDGVTFETVEGQMNCDSDAGNGGEVNFEWTLRTPGSTD